MIRIKANSVRLNLPTVTELGNSEKRGHTAAQDEAQVDGFNWEEHEEPDGKIKVPTEINQGEGQVKIKEMLDQLYQIGQISISQVRGCT